MTRSGQTFSIEIDKGNFSTLGSYCFNIQCYDGSSYETGSVCREVTPTGKIVSDIGSLSTGILYFFVLIGFGFIFLGYLFLKNDSVWIKYTGLFLMIVGFAFIYYDLHLSNLYATTIAINSGAENVTTGAFIMITNFLKLAPYLVAGIIGFASVKVLRASIKKNKNKDGWDDNNY
jgi:hypothetical protein